MIARSHTLEVNYVEACFAATDVAVACIVAEAVLVVAHDSSSACTAVVVWDEAAARVVDVTKGGVDSVAWALGAACAADVEYAAGVAYFVVAYVDNMPCVHVAFVALEVSSVVAKDTIERRNRNDYWERR